MSLCEHAPVYQGRKSRWSLSLTYECDAGTSPSPACVTTHWLIVGVPVESFHEFHFRRAIALAVGLIVVPVNLINALVRMIPRTIY